MKKQVSAQRHEPLSQASTSPSINTGQKSNPKTAIMSKEQLLSRYLDVFKSISRLPSLPYHIQVNLNITPKQTPCRPVPIHLKEAFKKEIDRMCQASIIKPVKEVTPWINSFILFEGKDKSGNLKLSICLDPMNLNKAIICEPYHFKTPEDITHLIANSCVMTVCDCKKGYWHQELDEASSFLTTFYTAFGRFQ